MTLDNRKNDKKIDQLWNHIDERFLDIKEDMKDMKQSVQKQQEQIHNIEKENFGLKTTLSFIRWFLGFLGISGLTGLLYKLFNKG